MVTPYAEDMSHKGMDQMFLDQSKDKLKLVYKMFS